MSITTIIKARGLLTVGTQVLLCKEPNKNFFFLPGGCLEQNENLPSCLVREFKEELGIEIFIGPFLGCIECHYKVSQTVFQELNRVFKIATSHIFLTEKLISLEKHIEFHLIDIDKLNYPSFKILPARIANILFSSPIIPTYQFENQIIN